MFLDLSGVLRRPAAGSVDDLTSQNLGEVSFRVACVNAIHGFL